MAGFNNTPPASEFHTYSSWGRTRQPKNVAGSHTAGVEVVASGADAFTATSGYSTENQRYLHLFAPACHADDDNDIITVWGYVHAFGAWFILKNAAAANVTIQLDKDAAVSTYTGGNTIDVLGVDRIAFRNSADNALHNDSKLMAAVNSAPAK